ncbi:MAG TPA: zinc ribbon domain-containing protein [Ignavibacteria bacterium]|nr:zinc ribbon domain-containing protein [Ignavibacteria bacterium]
MSLVTCPNCKAKVDLDNDFCPECGYHMFNFEVNTHEDTFHDSYDDYTSTTKDAKPIYKFLFFVSLFGIFGGLFWGIYQVILQDNPVEDAKPLTYLIVYISIALLIITQILSYFEKNNRTHN